MRWMVQILVVGSLRTVSKKDPLFLLIFSRHPPPNATTSHPPPRPSPSRLWTVAAVEIRVPPQSPSPATTVARLRQADGGYSSPSPLRPLERLVGVIRASAPSQDPRSLAASRWWAPPSPLTPRIKVYSDTPTSSSLT